MDKLKRPVSVGGIEFDALISQEDTLEATVPEYAVEEGYTVSDHIILSQEALSMTLYVTETPATWKNRFGTNVGRVEEVIEGLKELYYAGEPVTVKTSGATYENMAIESITITKSKELGYAREIPISFRKVRVTETSTTTIPDSYGKSGTTELSAGTANTSSGESASSTSSSNTSSSSSSSTSSSSSASSDEDDDSSTSTKSSILYKLGQSVGLIN